VSGSSRRGFRLSGDRELWITSKRLLLVTMRERRAQFHATWDIAEFYGVSRDGSRLRLHRPDPDAALPFVSLDTVSMDEAIRLENTLRTSLRAAGFQPQPDNPSA